MSMCVPVSPGDMTCQRNKRSPGKPAKLLQPLHIPQGPWDSVSTDFVTGLPKAKAGLDAIFVFVDQICSHCSYNNEVHCTDLG